MSFAAGVIVGWNAALLFDFLVDKYWRRKLNERAAKDIEDIHRRATEKFRAELDGSGALDKWRTRGQEEMNQRKGEIEVAALQMVAEAMDQSKRTGKPVRVELGGAVDYVMVTPPPDEHGKGHGAN